MTIFLRCWKSNTDMQVQYKCNASAKQNDAKERKEKEIKENNNNSFLDRKESEKCFSPKDSFGGILGNYQKKIALRWPAIDEDIHITSFYDKTEPEYDNKVAAV